MYDNLTKLVKVGIGPALHMSGSARPPTPGDISIQPPLPKPRPEPTKRHYSPNMGSTTFTQQIAPAYSRVPGGYDEAVHRAIAYRQNRSQRIQQQPDPTIRKYMSKFTPLTFTRDSLDYNRYPFDVVPNLPWRGQAHTDAYYPKFTLSTVGARILPTVDHEISHLAFERHPNNFRNFLRVGPANIKYLLGLDAPAIPAEPRHSLALPAARPAYYARPEEIDVRLAEIKRRFAETSGEHVDSPEQAARALDWYNRTIGRPDKGWPDRANFDKYFPKNEIDKNSPTWQIFIDRMPELVQSYPQLQRMVS